MEKGFLWRNLSVRDHLEVVDVNGWIVLKDLKETGCEELEWT